MRCDGSFTKTLLKGLVVILPVAIIGVTTYWLLHTLEAGFAHVLRVVLPDSLYYPGMGLVVAVLTVYLVGLLMGSRAAQRLSDRWEHMLKRIPLVKSLYGAVQDIVQFFSSDKKKRFNKVVSVTLRDSAIRLIGFVTREDLSSLPQLAGATDTVVVYLPMSYQIGGYMALVPRSAVEPIDMSIEDASRLVFTAGMSIDKGDLLEGREVARDGAAPSGVGGGA
jgi:uncharacterized membrane protein